MPLFLRSCAAVLFLFLTLTKNSSAQEKLTLPQAIALATANNPEILAAQKEIEAATGRILQAGHIPNPEVAITFNEMPTNFNLGDAGEKDISIFQPLEFPGKRGARIEVAGHDRAVTVLAQARLKTIVTSRVTKAYYQVLLAGEFAQNLDFNITLLNDFLKIVTERYQAGTSTYLDVIRAKVELARLRNELVEAQRDFTLKIGELNLLLGRGGETPVTLTDSLGYQPLRLPQDSVMAMLSAQSVFLKIIEREAQRHRSLLHLTQKSYLPDFALGFALQNRPGQTSPTGSSRYFGFEVGVSVPLYFWQAPRGEVREARALVDLGALRLEAARRRVRQSIMNAYRLVEVANQQVQSFETALLRDAEDELRAGIFAYQNNQVDALNLFDIYRTYRATKIEYARALYNYAAARAELEASAEVPE